MNEKIYLSPSNQTDNRYAYGDTNEAAQCRRMADAAEQALIRCGFSVKNGGTGTMAGKVAQSNDWGADLHICIHTNAFNGKVSGTRIFCSDLESAGGKAAQAIFAVLAPLTPGTAENIKVRSDLYEITNTKAYCVYVEVDFHDVASVAQWLIENTTAVGEAIAQGICNHYGVAYVPAAQELDPEKRYFYLGDVPDMYRSWLDQLVEKGFLQGRGGTGDDLILDLSEDVVRCLVILARAIFAV